jgi:hypothetical protein
MEQLEGGREEIKRDGDEVHRPIGKWTPQMHRVLHHLRERGFVEAPLPLGFDAEGREIVTFVKGEVSNSLSGKAASVAALKSAAELLRRYHDAVSTFSLEATDPEKWMLPPRPPTEIVCHGDFAPYNVVLNGTRAVGLIDFDTAHPGPRTWDIAYALYRWAPFTNPDNPDGFGSVQDQIERARHFCEAYGLASEARRGLADLMVLRLQALIDFMVAQAKADNEVFVANVEDGHHTAYLADIKYLGVHRSQIDDGLVGRIRIG